MMSMPTFECLHCHSRHQPETFVDERSQYNKQILAVLMLVILMTCCIGFPLIFLYPFLAARKFRCSECGTVVD
jgi:hypothetical protein